MSAETLPLSLSIRIATQVDPPSLAALHTLAYADVFDYPLTAAEVQRYLIGVAAGLDDVRLALEAGLLPAGWIEAHGPYYTLPGRGALAGLRVKRQAHAQGLWRRARRYGRWLAALPYTRMVAVTGALAMDNEPGRDLDFLVVTQPGRLWLCRGLAMLLVRLARRFGDELCPNYFITTRALRFPTEDLYTAHELAQMTPLHGLDVYHRIRRLNAWTEAYLPNAGAAPRTAADGGLPGGLRRLAEAALRAAPGERLERWEMQRKVRKLSAQRGPATEADFSRDWCKGHFGGYGKKTLEAYQRRLEGLTFFDIQNR